MIDTLTLETLQEWVDGAPFHRLLAIQAVSFDKAAGEVVLRIPFSPDMRRADDGQEFHGGVTASLIDIAGEYALAVTIGHTTPTINMRVDYLRMVRDSALTATAHVIKTGRSIGFVDISVADDDGRLVAIGRCNYSTR
ncbi:MAG: PaaI family thioesterase [Alphaproteobacteria bacterium]